MVEAHLGSPYYLLQLAGDGRGGCLLPVTLPPDCNLNRSFFQLPSIGGHKVDVSSGLGVVGRRHVGSLPLCPG